MAGRTVRVQGFPAELPPDRAADKLTIHFLRSRNGGGDIANVRVLPGSLPCALITFEAPEVAQRILKVKNHVLAIGKTQYPLEVTPHAAELSPNEIFIHMSMTIDYSKLPTGKTLLKDLHKEYKNIHFSFDSKNMQCIVQGPFTELQTFSRELLGRLNLKREATGQMVTPASSCGAKEMGTPDHQQVPDSTESAQETAKQPDLDQVQEMAAKVPSPQSPVGEEAAGLLGKLEDFSLTMDLDIYLYMQRFCAAEFQGVLHQHHVDVVDVSADGIAVVYLQPSGGVSGDTDALRQARLALQQLYQQLEVSLHKEKIAKEGLGMDSQAVRAVTRELKELYPQLLCHEDVKQLYLVGNLVDVSKAKQFLEDSVTGRGAAHTVDMLSSSQPSGTTEAALHLAKSPVNTSTTRLSPSKSELKGEHKLAANFSTPKADKSQAAQGFLVNQDSPIMGQEQLSGKHSSEIDAPGQSDPRALTQQYQPPTPMTNKAVGSAAEPQQNDPTERGHVEGGARLRGEKMLLPFTGKENSTSQHPEVSKGSGPIGYCRPSSNCDVTWTSFASGCKPSASRPVLRRSNSFSLTRLKESSNCGEISMVSEEISLDTLQWFYLKDVCHATIDELCRAGGVHILERHAGDCTVLVLQAEDRKRLLQAKWKVEDLVQKCPDLVCQSVSYSELAVSGPDDSDLSELCSLLRGKSFQVGLSKDKYKLYLACPKEMLPGVTEAFHMFSSRRLCAMKSPSMSPGPERSSVIQPSRSQDSVLDVALPGSLNALQHLNIIDKINSTDVLRASWLPETKERSPSPWRYQQAWGQEEATGYIDSGSGRRGSSLLNISTGDKPSPPSLREFQEQMKTKLALGEPDITQLKQVLPDRFQFTRDKSRGGHNEAMGQQHCPVPVAHEAPHSLHTWPPRAMAAEPPPAVAQEAPTAEPTDWGRAQLPGGRSNEQEEPDLPSQQRRDPSLGQESSTIPLDQCYTCKGSGVTCQGSCGHTLCRTCFAVDSMQPAGCESFSAVPSYSIPGTLKISSLSQSLPGYYGDTTLQLAYSMPDGVQKAGDPRPGHPYKGGNFCAFLPDNKEGLKIARLLKKAFECGLTFQIKSCNGEERVTWGPIPHKTSWEGGKARYGPAHPKLLGMVVVFFSNGRRRTMGFSSTNSGRDGSSTLPQWQSWCFPLLQLAGQLWHGRPGTLQLEQKPLPIPHP
ncbi:uncharacterized protein LOC121347609 isoform X1 [Onychostruthus taczanowskii]|uniref:uncharacterized protein LOC121347609 isoform X1 n=1 Tax=Onychostruthus taczanowskii TaxID=356909 RepID=UPI001B80BC40|nr:uncharacterized protein LOC121347609 isoform X1 [Onychostruthus taczanowskii]